MPILKDVIRDVEIPYRGIADTFHFQFINGANLGLRKGYPAHQHGGRYPMMEGAPKDVVELLVGGVYRKGRVIPQYQNVESDKKVEMPVPAEFEHAYGEIFYERVIEIMSTVLYGDDQAINLNDLQYQGVKTGDPGEITGILAGFPVALLKAIFNHLKEHFFEHISESPDHFGVNNANEVMVWLQKDASAIQEMNAIDWRNMIDAFMVLGAMREWEAATAYSIYLRNEVEDII